MVSSPTPLFYLVILLFIHQLQSTCSRLLQVQIVHRHGARAHLQKNSPKPGLESGAPLLEKGFNQARDLGTALRERYLQQPGFQEKYSNATDVRAVSSNLERTLGSSRGFLSGLYPEVGRIPTHVFGGVLEDYWLRGYAICSKFEERVKDFYGGKEFLDKEKESEELRTKFAQRLKEDVGLDNWFNVYDRILLKERGYEVEEGDVKINLASGELQEIEELAAWVELRKYGRKVAGNLVGGGLLSEMIDRAENFSNGNKSTDHRIVEYSAHYPTLLGLFSALRITSMPAVISTTIPDFSAAIIWELHQDSDSMKNAKMFYYPGGDSLSGSSEDFIPVAFGFSGCSDAEGECPLSVIKSETSNEVLNVFEFCEACESPNVRQPAFCSANASREKSYSRYSRVAAGTIGALLGVALGLSLSLLYVMCVARRQRRKMVAQSAIVPREFDQMA